MTPPCRVFESSALEHEIQTDVSGRKRKVGGGGDIDLAKCSLFGMVQYECEIDRPDIPNSAVRCWPVQRWFRRCQDQNGTFTVETTNWEGRKEKEAAPSSTSNEKGKSSAPDNVGWTHSWRERDMSKQGQYRDI